MMRQELQPLHSPQARQQLSLMMQSGAMTGQDNATQARMQQQQQQQGVSLPYPRDMVHGPFGDDNRTVTTAWGSLAGPNGGYRPSHHTPAAWEPEEAEGSGPPSYHHQRLLRRSTSSPGMYAGRMGPGREIQTLAAPVIMVPASMSHTPGGLDASCAMGAGVTPLLALPSASHSLVLPSASHMELQQRQQLQAQRGQAAVAGLLPPAPLSTHLHGGGGLDQSPAAALLSDLQCTPAATGQQQQQELGSGDLPFDSEGLLLLLGSNSGGRINSWSADALPRLLQSDEGLPRVLLHSDDAVLPLYTRWMEEGPDGGAL